MLPYQNIEVIYERIQMKRPLAYFSVVFASVLFVLQLWAPSFGRRNPVELSDGRVKLLVGYEQDDSICLRGTVKDYSYNNQYGQITTELILKEVQIIPQNEDKSKEKSNNQITKENPKEENTEKENTEKSVGLAKGKESTAFGQTILVYVTGKEDVTIGSQVIVSGGLSFFSPASNPGEFDSEKYYRNRDVLFAVKKAKIQQVGVVGDEIALTNPLRDKLAQKLKEFRLRQEENLMEQLEIGNAAIMRAMLFGNKKELEEDIKNLYQNNGIAHILAISGLHISLLGMAVYNLLLKLPIPNWLVLAGSEIFLLLYGCMVGFSPSTFRAIFMFTLFLLSKIWKRSYDMLTSMAVSAIIQLTIHPGYLFDCGFQLSYAAILGIGIVLPVLVQLKDSLKNKWVKQLLAPFLPSLSVTILTAPILIYHYYELSFFSIALNLIVLPLMAPLLLLGVGMLCVINLRDGMGIMLAVLVGRMSILQSGLARLLFSYLIELFAFGVNAILWVYETGCRILEMLPIGRKNIAPLSIETMIIYYMLLFAMTVLVKKKSHSYQFVFVVLCIGILLLPKKLDFSVWALDVGQGDCNVIFTEERNCFVIDCGSTSKGKVGKNILIPFLKYHGIGRVNGVIMTHPDADHMSGILELIELSEEENIVLDGIYIGEHSFTSEPEEWKELISMAKEVSIPVLQLGQGDMLRTDSLSMECIYPLAEQTGLTGNAASLVLKLECEDFQGLFTGDLEVEGERKLIAEYRAGDRDLPDDMRFMGDFLFGGDSCDFLKVGHHGSSGSGSEEFLQWVNPKCAVISCGENNRYGHPHKETLERLEAEGVSYWITYEEGAVCFRDE